MDQNPAEAIPAAREGRDLLPLLQGFQVNRCLTFNLLEALSEEELHRCWPRPGLNTLGRQMQEMALVEEAFVAALHSGVMDFSNVPGVSDFPDGLGKARVWAMLHEADSKLEAALQGPVRARIRWDDIHLPVEGHLTNLISHEVFHQGQMALALYLLHIRVPQSWCVNWALPPNE